MTTLLTRSLAGAAPVPRHAMVIAERNVIAARAGGVYWWIILGGLAEPLLYLLAVGWGLGTLAGDLTLTGGQAVPYMTFVAPGLLAGAAMNGAVAEATNFFTRLTMIRQYEPVLDTPVAPVDVAFGELCWGTLRSTFYITAFLVVMVTMRFTTPLRALAVLPIAILVGFMFGALGMALVTFMRSWRDLDQVHVVQFGLFLFSGTFAPIETYPGPLQAVARVTPLYHGVELVRSVNNGTMEWGHVCHLSYLLAATALGLAVAGRRTNIILRSRTVGV